MDAPSRGSCTQKIPRTLANGELTMYHQSSRCLVKEVAAAALHLAMQSRQTLAGLFTILATFLLS